MTDAALVDDDVAIEEQPTPEETPETPEVPPEPPKVEFSEEQQAFINEKIVAEKVRKQRDAEREAEEARQQAEEYKAKLEALEKTERPNIPAPPDPFDDNYESKIAERDEQLRKAAEWDAKEQLQLQQQQLAEQEQQVEANRKLVQTAQTYTERAEKLGISPQDLQIAGNMVGQYGLSDDVAQYILSDERGPEITMYLSKNINELDMVRQMHPMQAAAYLETVKGKAQRPAPETPPPPVDEPNGLGGFPEGRGPKGATYE